MLWDDQQGAVTGVEELGRHAPEEETANHAEAAGSHHGETRARLFAATGYQRIDGVSDGGDRVDTTSRDGRQDLRELPKVGPLDCEFVIRGEELLLRDRQGGPGFYQLDGGILIEVGEGGRKARGAFGGNGVVEADDDPNRRPRARAAAHDENRAGHQADDE